MKEKKKKSIHFHALQSHKRSEGLQLQVHRQEGLHSSLQMFFLAAITGQRSEATGARKEGEVSLLRLKTSECPSLRLGVFKTC